MTERTRNRRMDRKQKENKSIVPYIGIMILIIFAINCAIIAMKCIQEMTATETTTVYNEIKAIDTTETFQDRMEKYKDDDTTTVYNDIYECDDDVAIECEIDNPVTVNVNQDIDTNTYTYEDTDVLIID